MGDLLLTVNTLSESIFDGQVKADSLRSRITATEQEIKRLEIYRDIVLANERQDIDQKIADKKIVLNRELLHDRQALENDLAAERIKLDMVTPLERVGQHHRDRQAGPPAEIASGGHPDDPGLFLRRLLGSGVGVLPGQPRGHHRARAALNVATGWRRDTLLTAAF